MGNFYKVCKTLLLISYLALETQIYYDTNYHYPVRIQKVPNINALMTNYFAYFFFFKLKPFKSYSFSPQKFGFGFVIYLFIIFLKDYLFI